MEYGKYLFDGSKKYSLDSVKPWDREGDKAKGKKKLAENVAKISELQNALYADGSKGLLVVFQAMDAAGKDGTIRHVFSGVNPQGVTVSSFKTPSAAEAAHDYLWRIHAAVPARGMIGVFNRSHYESVLIEKVLDLPAGQNLPRYVRKDFWKNRYRQINEFEQLLYESGITIRKFFLHVSKAEQSRRFLARIEDPAKNYKFSKADLNTSEHWDAYMKAFRDAINHTAAPHAPWCVVPADHKWFMRLLVSQVVLDTLTEMKPAYPKLEKDKRAELEECRDLLEKEVAEAGERK